MDSSAFGDSVGAKIRDPESDLVATYRLMNVKVAKPDADDRAAHQLLWQASGIGMMPMSWPAPNGQPIVGAAWASPSRVMGSMGTHYTMAGGWWPNQGIHYPTPTSWLPRATHQVRRPRRPHGAADPAPARQRHPAAGVS